MEIWNAHRQPCQAHTTDKNVKFIALKKEDAQSLAQVDSIKAQHNMITLYTSD